MSFLLLFCHDQFADEGTVFVAAAAAAITGNTDGLTLPAKGEKLAQTTTSTALSLHDFNLFRKIVAEAINTLDKKIESILAITAPSC